MTLTEITTILQLIKQNSSDLVLIAIMLLIVVAFATAIISTIKFTTILLKRKILGDEEKCNLDPTTKDCDVKSHQFFYRILNMERYNVYKINFGGKIRNLLFADMLQIKLKIFREAIEEFLKKDVKTTPEWEMELTTSIEKAIQEYNDKWIEFGCPQIAIEKFNSWHKSRVKRASEMISDIAHSNYYSTIRDRNIVMLDILTVLFNDTCEDMYNSAWELNGELTGILYKGQPIEALIHKH